MRAVSLPAAFLSDIKAHARATYPDECCGFLLTSAPDPADDRPRTIGGIERARNEYNGERRRRFLIPADELREVEVRTERSGRLVVGFYHSHPNHPARPSQFDQDHAWPWYSYLVLSVTATDEPAVAAFELDPDTAAFHEVPLRIDPEPNRVSSVV